VLEGALLGALAGGRPLGDRPGQPVRELQGDLEGLLLGLLLHVRSFVGRDEKSTPRMRGEEKREATVQRKLYLASCLVLALRVGVSPTHSCLGITYVISLIIGRVNLARLSEPARNEHDQTDGVNNSNGLIAGGVDDRDEIVRGNIQPDVEVDRLHHVVLHVPP